MTQNNLILDYFLAGNSLTPLDALNKFGCFRLGARVYDLKKQGHNIKSRLIGNSGKNFAQYWLEK